MSTMSFAHLQGIAKASADDEDEDKDKEREESRRAKKAEDDGDDDDADARAKKAEDADPDEDEDDDKDKARAEDGDDDPEDDDKEKDKDGKKAQFRRGTRAERSRWTAVVGHRAFARNPALGARLLSTTSMPARAVIGVLRDTAPAHAAHPERSARNPNLGPSGGPSPTSTQATAASWDHAFKRIARK